MSFRAETLAYYGIKKTAAFKMKTAVVEHAGDKLYITFRASTRVVQATISELSGSLKAFDSEVFEAQRIPIPSGTYKTAKEGVFAIPGNLLGVYITREFKWSDLEFSYESYYTETTEEMMNITEKAILGAIMDTLRERGWKPSVGHAIK